MSMFDQQLEKDVIAFIDEHESVLGIDLSDAFDQRYFDLWRVCQNSQHIYSALFARWYLRVDSEIEGYARLSPSILRNFLTYVRFSNLENLNQAVADGEKQRKVHREISEKKRAVGRKLILDALPKTLLDRTGILIAGDVCRDMAHEVPRPERSTGEIIKGSDIDLILVIGEEDQTLREELEGRLLEAKNMYLRHPALREELDFVVNSIPHYQEVSAFDTPKQMISCKAALEGQFVSGDRQCILKARDILVRADIPRKVLDMTERAFSQRLQTIERLRKNPKWINSPQEKQQFYFSDEIWEFMFD